MGYKSGGLSYFEDGGSSDVDESTAQPTPSVNIGGKGKKAVIANEGVLQAMQDLYAERAARHGGFMEAMKDATAWWSGGVQGPGEALAKRDEQRMKQAAELFSIQQQIAAQRNAMEARDRFLGKAPAAAAEGAPGVTAAQAQQGVAAVNQQTGGLLDLVKDPSLKQQIGAQYLSDPDKAMGQLNTYLSKQAEPTQLQKNIKFMAAPVTEGGLGVDQSQLAPIAVANVAGSGAFVPHDVRTQAGTQQTTPLQAAAKIATPPGVGGPANPNLAAPKPMPQAQPAPAQGAQPAAAQPQTRPAAPAPAAPAAAPSGPSNFGFAPGSKEDLELRQKAGEAVIEGRKSEAVETGKDLALQRAGTVEAGSSAPEQLARIDYLEQMVNNPKTRDAFGVLQKPGVMAAIQTMLSEGVSLATLGPVGFKGLEDAITKLGGTQEQIDARQKAAREFALMQLQNAKTLLKGQGAVSDAERKLVADMSGNVGKSPNAIKDLLAWSRIRTNYDQKNGAAYSEFIRRNPNASFQEYRNSPLYQQIKDEYIGNLQTFTRASARSVTKQPHPAESLLDMYAPRKK